MESQQNKKTSLPDFLCMVYNSEIFPYILWTVPHLQDHIFFGSGKNTVLRFKMFKISTKT